MGRVFLGLVILVFLLACGAGQVAPPEVVARTAPVDLLSPSPTSLPPTLTPSSTSSPTIAQPLPPDTPIPTPAATRTPAVEKRRDLSYFRDGDHKQILDIYLPTNSGGPFPTLLTIHSGGGDKSDFASFALRFVKQGYAVVSINHREMPEDIYPAAVQDAFCALAWMHAHASEYNLDPKRFFALGRSSGGTLVAILGVVETPELFLENCPHQLPAHNSIQGIVTFTGIFDYPQAALYSTGLKSYIDSYLGVEQSASPAIWAEASPVSWLDGGEPPFLVIHGEADRNIDPRQSIDFAAALGAAGVSTQLLLIPDLDHAGIVRSEVALDAVEAFLAALISP